VNTRLILNQPNFLFNCLSDEVPGLIPFLPCHPDFVCCGFGAVDTDDTGISTPLTRVLVCLIPFHTGEEVGQDFVWTSAVHCSTVQCNTVV
jgi:hypothetical protein